MLKRLFPLRISMYLCCAMLLPSISGAQQHRPVKWHFTSVPFNEKEVSLVFTATLDEGWHVYSQFIEEGGPLPTTFTFKTDQAYSLRGKVKEESTPYKTYNDTFMMDIVWFAKTAVFSQKVALHAPSAVIQGKIEFMVCTDEMCLPPDEIAFSLEAKVEKPEKENGVLKSDDRTTARNESNQRVSKVPASVPKSDSSGATGVIKQLTANPKKDTIREESLGSPAKKRDDVIIQSKKSDLSASWGLWSIFAGGFLGGIAAFLMPCIFPMLPFTISYFVKRAKTKKKVMGLALLYGLSIIVLYVFLGLSITLLFGSGALNDLSTSGIFNLFFFLLLMVFGASLLGAFEINLPSSWVNAVDAKAEHTGILGIFFMAATLALVSFSCTGPIVGTLLVEASQSGAVLGPAVGMLGFSLALALPFTLFAMFPGWLKTMPKSGSWLNSIKVVLGFLELALALKFLSNVDLAYHWKWLDREVFLALWIIIFGLLGLYLLGKLKFPHDGDMERISPARLFLAIVALAFTLYMIPGLWGAPLKVVAAFLPPQQTQDFDLYTDKQLYNKFISAVNNQKEKRYSDIFQAPHNLDAFFDYDEGLAYARQVNKPVMIDFTGHACVNCRKMEATIWPKEEVLKYLREDYVLIQLYVDDRTLLNEVEQEVSPFSGKLLKTLGNKWSDLQASVFNTNAQPYYVLLDHNGNQLVPSKGADYDSDSFAHFLCKGLSEFESKR
jgi:thiol:disulfide interchange protein